MIEGIVIKAYSGYYYVQQGENVWTCRLRGKFRLSKQDVLVGDRVMVKPADNETGTIYEVMPRKNQLVRPLVANIEQAIIIFAVKNPEPNLDLLDRFLILAEGAKIRPVICLNKADLLMDSTPRWVEIYQDIGYPVLLTSAKNSLGLAQLKQHLRDKVSVLAGPSGVGKSSLLNAIQPGLNLQIGEISKKLKRGRHTTRHVELLSLKIGGLVADTPGFSNLRLPDIPSEELFRFFPEMIFYANHCRFNSCLHHKEPGCAVKDAVDSGKIGERRHHTYTQFLTELQEQERRY